MVTDTARHKHTDRTDYNTCVISTFVVVLVVVVTQLRLQLLGWVVINYDGLQLQLKLTHVCVVSVFQKFVAELLEKAASLWLVVSAAAPTVGTLMFDWQRLKADSHCIVWLYALTVRYLLPDCGPSNIVSGSTGLHFWRVRREKCGLGQADGLVFSFFCCRFIFEVIACISQLNSFFNQSHLCCCNCCYLLLIFVYFHWLIFTSDRGLETAYVFTEKWGFRFLVFYRFF